MTLSLDATVRVPDDVVFRELDGEAVVLNLESGMYFGLDEVGTRIWQLVEEHRSLRRALDALIDEFDASDSQLERDLLQFVEQLCAKGLAVIV
jgi:hypothetical protein